MQTSLLALLVSRSFFINTQLKKFLQRKKAERRLEITLIFRIPENNGLILNINITECLIRYFTNSFLLS